MTIQETAVQQTTCTRPSVCFLKYGGGVYDGCTIVDLGPLHMSLVDRTGPDAGTNFTLYSYQKSQLGFRNEKGAKLEKRSKHDEHKNYHSFAYF